MMEENDESHASLDKTERELDKIIERSPRQIMKNVVTISCVFMLLFSSYLGLGYLQSSLHVDKGIGVIAQATVYACMIVSALFIPSIAIEKLGHKLTVMIAITCYILWMAANGYARWATMVPASILLGLSGPPLWTAGTSFLSLLGKEYGQVKHKPGKVTITFFFGICFGLFYLGSTFGSLVSSTVLFPRHNNYSMISEEDLVFCGMADCPRYKTRNVYLRSPPSYVVWMLVGIYVGISLLSLLLAGIFIDPIPSHLVEEKKHIASKKPWWSTLIATIKQLRYSNQLLLIPLSTYFGFKVSFISAEFYKSWVTCYRGIWMVGWSAIPFSVSYSLMSFVGGRLVRYTGRVMIFIAAYVIELSTLLTLMLRQMDPEKPYLFYLIPVMCGLGQSLLQVQIFPLYEYLFPEKKDATFSNHLLWSSVGYTIGFGYSSFLCTSTKLYIVLGVLVVAILGYATVELRIKINKTTRLQHVASLTVTEINETDSSL